MIFIFTVVIYEQEKMNKFEELKLSTKSFLKTNESITSINFHGTKMCNIYSILSSGLLSHFSKNCLFGEGTYLSQEPSISLHYTISGKAWEKSIISEKMSCLLTTETVNNPNHVKIGIEGNR
jgi:hypothetical protein